MAIDYTRIGIAVDCPICGSKDVIEVEAAAVEAWKSGVNIQDAFPLLTDSLRERLNTGICERCWDDLWESGEDDK